MTTDAQALIARLLAGTGGGKHWMDLHTEAADALKALQDEVAQLTAELRTAISAARVRALEDAVQVVLNHQAGWVPDGFTECADAIRALKRGG